MIVQFTQPLHSVAVHLVQNRNKKKTRKNQFERSTYNTTLHLINCNYLYRLVSEVNQCSHFVMVDVNVQMNKKKNEAGTNRRLFLQINN